MSNLLIVESPAKAKTIKKYLGKDFDVVASMGHVRDLPNKKLSVNIKKSFEPVYEIKEGKEKLVKELQESSEKYEKIFLATDPDREGEAISWHLAYLLDLRDKENNRVTFNEITKSGVSFGMENPRNIDMDLVNAQQARRILDRIVGYKLSPFLSGRIRRGLSAGRVQSVAVKIIVDRENEIRKFTPKEYWTISAKFFTSNKKIINALFYGIKKKKLEIKTEKEAQDILKNLDNAEYFINKIKKGTRKIAPAPPFITSTLQQEASRKLNFTSKKTMKIAQELYEGLEIKNHGTVGLITYMRTDSLRLSDDALLEARSFIKEKWGKEYLPKESRVFKKKNNVNAQDAHEAIRPTKIDFTPEDIEKSLSNDQFKLYKLIWQRFIACQMAECVRSTTQVDISAGEYVFKTSGFIIKFDGFTVLYEESKELPDEKAKELPEVTEGERLKLKEIKPNQHFTEPPPRYNEASLIKALETNGIGRPSTYAPTISTILAREYIKRENKQLIPTELGEVVNNLMSERFPNIVNMKFTAEMENQLDTIEKGENNWIEILKNFWSEFKVTLKKAKEEMKGVKILLESDKTDEICELCGKPMIIKYGRFGKFLSCTGYPECKGIKKIASKIIADCPKCDEGKAVERISKKKKRIFYGCNKYPKCDFVSWDEPINEKCPTCRRTLLKKKGKKSKIYCINESCGYEKFLNKEGSI